MYPQTKIFCGWCDRFIKVEERPSKFGQGVGICNACKAVDEDKKAIEAATQTKKAKARPRK